MRLEEQRWFHFAREDLQMAELALLHGVCNQVCFHAQQAAEKMLKGIAALSDKPIPKTHKIIDLLQILDGVAFGEIAEDLVLLDRFYIPTRYPDALPGALPKGLPGETDAIGALETARRLDSFVKKHFPVVSDRGDESPF